MIFLKKNKKIIYPILYIIFSVFYFITDFVSTDFKVLIYVLISQGMFFILAIELGFRDNKIIFLWIIISIIITLYSINNFLKLLNNNLLLSILPSIVFSRFLIQISFYLQKREYWYIVKAGGGLGPEGAKNITLIDVLINLAIYGFIGFTLWFFGVYLNN